MISVCITTFNGEKHILEQINSIISQISDKDEVVVSDDGSTDQTVRIIEELKDNRIKIYQNKSPKGIISNVQNALIEARGEIIFLADQDDVWLPNKVSICLKALENSDLVVSDCYIVNGNLNLIETSFYIHNKSQTNKWRALIRNSYLGCCMAFKRSILEDALPFPTNIPMHDIWLGNVAAFKHKVRFIDDKLIYYRRHGNNASTASEPTKASILKQINYRLPIIQGLAKLFFKSVFRNLHDSE